MSIVSGIAHGALRAGNFTDGVPSSRAVPLLLKLCEVLAPCETQCSGKWGPETVEQSTQKIPTLKHFPPILLYWPSSFLFLFEPFHAMRRRERQLPPPDCNLPGFLAYPERGNQTTSPTKQPHPSICSHDFPAFPRPFNRLWI